MLGSALGLGLAPSASRACEVQAEFLRVVHPWTRATAPGDATAVLCMRIDEVTADDRLVGVDTPVAGDAQLVLDGRVVPLDLPLAAGSQLEMHDRGVHLRLTGLRHPLQTGRSYPLRLQFARSGDVLATLSVDYERFL